MNLEATQFSPYRLVVLGLPCLCQHTATSASLFTGRAPCVCIPSSFFFYGRQPHWIRACPNDLIVTRSSAKALFHIRLHFEVLGIRTATFEFRGTPFNP